MCLKDTVVRTRLEEEEKIASTTIWDVEKKRERPIKLHLKFLLFCFLCH